MKAIVMDRFGPADVLRLADVAEPELRENDLLVRVRAAGVNRADILQRQGMYADQPLADSELLGLELAGEVVAAGAAVADFAPGQRVMGIVGGGAYAEVARMDAGMAMPVPQGMDFAHAAAIPEVFVTAHEALFHLGGLEDGGTALIHAAAGGVGSAAVQLAHAAGARVFATASRAKLPRVREFGANTAIDYRSEDFRVRVLEETGGKGVDVVVDFIGGPNFAPNVEALAEGGRLIQVGLLGGAKAEIDLARILRKRLRIIGTVMKSRPQEAKRAMVRRFARRWLPRFADNTLRPVVDRTFPFEQAAAAQDYMESGANVGKIVLTT
ncbi:NAD(P)H quinone oxidoreductase, PIG3 family [Desulfovibrio sp. X2]|uniref:NAD(P)H-quinone oxidoreductase n=1 Tax=Desulfovibrio sp. X2 TaxID=941449 RepID=UPI000358C8A6|nr:NAD(P)H-quinone oxidoreductase [Desulfovibrio sp. X2]EPR44228.1 NAD(P)H quinone oxidoreductase, PIG3 family [Desulfovibrio sp. X2]